MLDRTNGRKERGIPGIPKGEAKVPGQGQAGPIGLFSGFALLLTNDPAEISLCKTAFYLGV